MLSKETWGPHLWYSMHFIALGFPNEASSIDKKKLQKFLYQFTKCYSM